MALTLASAADLLKEHHLLREIIQGDVWTDDPARIASADEPFAGITYDTRKVTPGTLLCCKGQFKAEYLNGIDEARPGRIRGRNRVLSRNRHPRPDRQRRT